MSAGRVRAGEHGAARLREDRRRGDRRQHRPSQLRRDPAIAVLAITSAASSRLSTCDSRTDRPSFTSTQRSAVRIPSRRILPSSMRTSRSAFAITFLSCVENTNVVWNDRLISFISSRIPAPVRLSRFAVGSSARMIFGCVASARAIATRWRCPPLSSDGRWCANLPSWTTSRNRATRSRRSLRPSSLNWSSGYSTFSSADSTGSRLNVWKMKPIVRARRSASSSGVRPEVSRPSMKILPVGRRVDAADEVEQRRLAAARGTGDREEHALLDAQGSPRAAPEPSGPRGGIASRRFRRGSGTSKGDGSRAQWLYYCDVDCEC